MGLDMKITFPGGKKVFAETGGMVIETDQPKLYGGDGTAPAPYALFLASIGTCAGIFILGFCRERKISTEGMHIRQSHVYEQAPDGKSRFAKIILDIVLPPGFPDKYKDAIIRVADQCAVKKTIFDPPAFEIITSKE